MKTRWGRELDPNNVLSEYPRPQLVRDSYLNLNGYWDYGSRGTDETPTAYDGRILVPFSPESELSGVNRTLTPTEFLFYRRRITLPDDFHRGRLLMHFGAVDQIADVYLNGRHLKRHVGGFTPFSVELTDDWKEGEENELVVRVVDTTDTSYHSRGKQKTQRGGIWYTPQSGIWQTVWLESVPEAYIHGLRIIPDFDMKTVEIRADSDGDYAVSIELEGQKITGKSNQVVTIPLPGFEPWTPETPKLYDFTVRLGDDCVKSYFAMRKYSVEKGTDGIPRFFLNGEPYFMNGLLDQGYWSDGMLTAPSDEALIADLELTKELGFNMLRKHIKVEPLRWYYHCDRLGILVWQDMINGGGRYSLPLISIPVFFRFPLSDRFHGLFARGSADSRAQYRAELDELLVHLQNVPSIAVWVPFNEGWGQFDARATTEHVRSVDPTRLVDSASGWYDQRCGDFASFHIYFKPYAYKPDSHGRAVALTEFGGYNLRIQGHAYNEKDFGYKRLASAEELAEWLRKLYRDEVIPAIRGGLSAAIYTQLSDVEDELNGLVTYDREVVKLPAAVIREINEAISAEIKRLGR